MLPLNPSSTLTRPAAFVSEEWLSTSVGLAGMGPGMALRAPPPPSHQGSNVHRVSLRGLSWRRRKLFTHGAHQLPRVVVRKGSSRRQP